MAIVLPEKKSALLKHDLELIADIEVVAYKVMNEARHQTTYKFAEKVWNESFAIEQELNRKLRSKVSEVTCTKCKGAGYLASKVQNETRMLECSNCKGKGSISSKVSSTSIHLPTTWRQQ